LHDFVETLGKEDAAIVNSFTRTDVKAPPVTLDDSTFFRRRTLLVLPGELARVLLESRHD